MSLLFSYLYAQLGDCWYNRAKQRNNVCPSARLAVIGCRILDSIRANALARCNSASLLDVWSFDLCRHPTRRTHPIDMTDWWQPTAMRIAGRQSTDDLLQRSVPHTAHQEPAGSNRAVDA